MKIRNKKLLTKSIAMAIFMSSTLYTMPITHAAFNNNTLPDNGTGNVTINSANNIMNISQAEQNAVIQWNDFSIGANATVNFSKNDGGKFNTLNYVNSGNLSQIYGTINADKGNIYIVNPAGVQIGNSAQINVGSLYVSNKNMSDEQLKDFQNSANTGTPYTIQGNRSNAELMSLGNINVANKVTFDGNRIVLDIDRVKNGQTPLGVNNITIKTTKKDFDNKDVVLGYTAYDDRDGYEYTNDKNNSRTQLAKLILDDNSTEYITKADGFMWVKDGEQLQAMNTNLGGNYAFRNSIDLNATADPDVKFNSVGDSNNAFTGNLDGLGYEVYGLHIDEENNNTGLFGVVEGSTDKKVTIRNFNLISGSITNESENAEVSNTGAVVGNATNAVIENVKNTINVTGENNVGGIIGTGSNVTLNGVVNAGAIKGNSNVGGLAGNLSSSTLNGESYNLGDIKGLDTTTTYSYNIGGLVGLANNSTIGNETGFQMYNHLDVTGGYNVGGIVGNLDNSTVQNIYNDGTVNATGMTTEDYTFHTANKTNPNNKDDLEWSDGISKTVKDVAVANVGGIVGNSTNGTINDATNKADVQSNETTKNGDTYYIAGNVGGIVGKAMDTNMKNVTNEESNIRGAHNVGGIAGYFGNTDNIASDIKYTIENAINNGGDIMGTSARDINGDVITEIVRPLGGSREIFNVGNIGGIVGYMDGDNVYVTASGNRGTVHSKEIAEANKENPLNSSTAANVGGIVGKIDRSSNANLNTIEGDVTNAAVSNSYNSADVLGYTGVGGIAGMMYNGSVASSYNTGYLRTTRLLADKGGIDSLNMGGIVGDTTENTNSRSVLYDVYNKGQIGDDTYTYYGRHIGGVVGRLSGTVEKAYNNGAIYNGYNVVGGIVGWLSAGNVNNVFNTGNITVINQNTANSGTSQVGGIVGAVGNAHGAVTISNAYNLGALRTFNNTNINGVKGNSIGGILGEVSDGTGGIDNPVIIKDVYTTGNIYAGNIAGIKGTATEDTSAQIGKIFGRSIKQNGDYNKVVDVSNAYYIKPADNNGFTAIDTNNHEQTFEQSDNIIDVDYTARMNDNYNFSDSSAWRIYEGMTTPILNAFMPNSSKYLEDHNTNLGDIGITGVQYGTAYDPLMTFITANKNLSLNFSDLGITNSAGLVVKDYGLTLKDFTTANGAGGYFGGLIYADGALVLKGKDNEDIKLAGTSKLYGSSVDINSSGDLTINGLVQATANNKSTISDGNSGNINLTANNINVYGTLKTARTGETVTIEGLNPTRGTNIVQGTISDPNKDLTAIESLYAYEVTSKNDGDLTIKSNKDGNNQYKGDVNLYYGNLGQGLINVAGDVNLEGNNIYVDSDMVIDGNLNATADSTGEIVVDISNIGKVTNKNNTIDEMHDFLDSFSNQATEKKYINFTGTNNAKITIDMWDYNNNTFDLDKYDLDSDNTLSSKLNKLNVTGNNNETGKDFVYIWVADGEQLKGIQNYANKNNDSNILSYNFALKNDINATDVSGYQAIGGDYSNSNGSNKAFNGKFDGRENRIIGLNVDNIKNHTSTDNVGVFGVNAGTIKNLKVYSSTFKDYDNVGAIAGTNNGTIDNVTTLGNTVEALGSANSVVGAAGGVVGTNNGAVDNATSRDSVIAGQNSNEVLTIAGGIAGINTGLVSNSQSHSAVIASKTSTYSLGGIVGVNTAKDNIDDNKITAGLDNVNAYGVTGSSILVDNTGGIAGLNSGTLNDAYNESIVKGSSNVGGIAGTNSGEISLIVNGASVTAEGSYTGGLVGSATGTTDAISSISDGRNNGVITGDYYVGGLVGSNGENVELTNLTNDSSAEITGKQYVGGIAGTNSGSISTTDTNLINRGSITGNKYVGGIAGENNGTIENVKNDIVLNAIGSDAMYFGGVTGRNTEKGTITDATNRGNINASGATFVGGIAGQNDGTLSGAGNSNEGKVTGKDYVGGVAGLNTENAKITTKDNIIVIKNEGEVKAEAGGAGGIFGKNEANIQYAELSNSGTVTGTAGTTGTGGIFGENTGDIDHSSLKNEVNGNVSGVNNVGGLIGINSGTIEGGRDEASHYYKYQIYNNGTITATTSTGTNSTNIGGLIGKNTSTGKLTAGYNTGNIAASGSTDVGGIVGTNEGTVDQVFNTIAGNGNGSVKGNVNVGGLIGTNSGTLSNAYSTSAVKGNTDVGNVVGDNTSGTVTNIYATNTKGNLIGTNNGTINTSYSFSSSDKNKTNITYLEKEADQKDKDNYSSSFDKNTWKFYDGNANPLLKIFLTKAEFVPAKDNEGNNVKPYFVYNGKQQGVLISYNKDKNLVEVLDAKNTVIGTIKVANKDAAHSLEDYINTIGKGNQLINGVQFVDAGTYEMLFSQQINTDGKDGNPNNLGFDFVTSLDSTKPDSNNPPTITNDKAQINITLNDIERIYGNLNINSGNYGFTYGIANGQLTDEMKKELLNKLQLGTVDTTKDDGALVENGTKTNNANKDNENYYWTGTVSLDDSLLGNYEFTNNSNSITVNNGKSTVKKATIDIVAGDTTMNKGGNPAYSGSISGIVNGDSIDTVFGSNWHWGIEDSSLTDKVGTHTGVITINIDGKYYYFADQQELSNALKNYNVNIEAGDLTVKDNGGSVPIVPIEPIKPVVPGIWSHIYQDQWDRNRDFKERKAEFNFVDGAIPLDEAVEEV